MKTNLIFKDVRNYVIQLRNQPVILDCDVAKLYQVETKRINEAVKNNPGKFPQGYVFEIEDIEKTEVVENFVHLKQLKYSPNRTKAFTEKGLYMLATILKSPKATETSIAIIETFTKIRNLSQQLNAISKITHPAEKKNLIKKSGEIIGELLDSGGDFSDSETSFEINFALMKFKRTVKKKKS